MAKKTIKERFKEINEKLSKPKVSKIIDIIFFIVFVLCTFVLLFDLIYDTHKTTAHADNIPNSFTIQGEPWYLNGNYQYYHPVNDFKDVGNFNGFYAGDVFYYYALASEGKNFFSFSFQPVFYLAKDIMLTSTSFKFSFEVASNQDYDYSLIQGMRWNRYLYFDILVADYDPYSFEYSNFRTISNGNNPVLWTYTGDGSIVDFSATMRHILSNYYIPWETGNIAIFVKQFGVLIECVELSINTNGQNILFNVYIDEYIPNSTIVENTQQLDYFLQDYYDSNIQYIGGSEDTTPIFEQIATAMDRFLEVNIFPDFSIGNLLFIACLVPVVVMIVKMWVR